MALLKVMSKKRRIITTAALPYANGSIHIGHLVEYIQTDFWVRFQKMRGHQCLYICADDTHGTPIMIRARLEGITPEELIAGSQTEHLNDFSRFQIEFDHYSSTHCKENRLLVEKVFKAMEEKGHIEKRRIEQSYCEHDRIFLPDRFVVGICPLCGASNQYGDSCDSCGATYSPTDLIDSKCSICSNPPVKRKSDHLFFKLNHFRDFLKTWVPEHSQKQISNKLNEWFNRELRDWDISRDSPYFGFEIPGYPGKYFYVWMDAPTGYLASTEQWCKKNNLKFPQFWNDDKTEIYHFIGKDIVYFHALFWPAMLKNAEFKTPNRIFVHGFLTVNGEKMSKSKGTFLSAKVFSDHLDPTHLRYYYACKLSGIDDIDLNFEDFSQRINAELIGKITNLGSRGAQLVNKKLNGQISRASEEGLKIIGEIQDKADVIAELYEELNFSRAMIEIREMADKANRYFDKKTPWKLIKEDEKAAREVLTDILNIFRILSVYLKPIMPDYVQKVESLFGEKNFSWNSAQELVEEKKLKPFEHLSQRVDSRKVTEMMTKT